MGSNTKSDSPSPVPPGRLPKFEWHAPSDDCPRLSWPDWLMLVADQLAEDFPGETGLFLASVVSALGYQAHEMGAIGPDHQEQLAAEEADRAAAWLTALEAEVANPGGTWQLSQDELSDDHNGSLDGHPAQPDFEDDTGPLRGWISCDSEDETFCN